MSLYLETKILCCLNPNGSEKKLLEGRRQKEEKKKQMWQNVKKGKST